MEVVTTGGVLQAVPKVSESSILDSNKEFKKIRHCTLTQKIIRYSMKFPTCTMANKTRNLLVTLVVVGLLGLVGVMEVKRQAVSAQLLKLTSEFEETQGADAKAQNQELADQIIDQVRTMYNLPEGIEPTVATIVDIELLREKNPFYDKAENGDHLLVTADRAILFSSSKNMILDVIPVQLQDQTAPGGSEE